MDRKTSHLSRAIMFAILPQLCVDGEETSPSLGEASISSLVHTGSSHWCHARLFNNERWARCMLQHTHLDPISRCTCNVLHNMRSVCLTTTFGRKKAHSYVNLANACFEPRPFKYSCHSSWVQNYSKRKIVAWEECVYGIRRGMANAKTSRENGMATATKLSEGKTGN